jgi:hypothetical protein
MLNSLSSRPPHYLLACLQDMHKLMNKDKIILRFTARMTPGQSAVSHADAGKAHNCGVCNAISNCSRR